MKDKGVRQIEKIEHQFRPYGWSERFHDATRLEKRGKTTPYSIWPEDWKKIYVKGYPRLDSIPLKKEFSIKMKTPLDQVLRSRKSVREYKRKLLTTKELVTLLFFSGGVKNIPNKDWNFSRRFYPSGGGRYPLEIYVVLYNDTEIDKGVYHYNVKYHSLEILKKGDYLKELQKGLDPSWLLDANMAVLITAVFGRNQVKYGDRGYRHILTEVGHLAQNISLVTVALGLGSCALGGYLDFAINDLLDIDGVNESIVYTMIVGSPVL